MTAATSRRSGGKLWLLVIGPCLIALALATALLALQYVNARNLEAANRVVRAQGRATQDLAQGLLHYSLGTASGGTWQRARGLQLLRQAVDEYAEASAGLPNTSALREDFATELAGFQDLLEVGSPDQRTAQQDLVLRIALSRLQTTAEQVDAQLRNDQIQLAQHQSRLYRWSVGLVMLLVLGMAAFSWRGLRLRQRLQRERLSALRLLESVMKSSIDTIFAKDRDGRYILFSAAGERMMGTAAVDVIGRTDQEMFTRLAPIGTIRSTDDQIMGGADRLQYQLEVESPNGPRFVDVLKAPLYDENGVVTGVLGITRDITTLRSQGVALAESRAQLAAIIDSLDVGLVVAGANGALLHLNPAAVRLIGGDPTQPLPATLAEFRRSLVFETLDGTTLPSGYCPGERLMQGAESCSEELLVRRSDRIWSRILSFRGIAQRGSSGEPGFVLLTFEDITQRRQIESSLRQTQRLESLGTLAAGIAHDFNNLLLAISGHATLARAEMDEGQAPRESLEQIELAAKRAADLVRRILLSARVEQGERQKADLRPVVQQALKLFRPSLPERIHLHIDIAADESCLVDMDPSQIHQAVLNLLANAAHAVEDRPDGARGDVTASLQSVMFGTEVRIGGQPLAAGRYARFTIRDNGVGMEPAVLERIFDPFFTTKTVGRGTGLGMPMVHGIVLEHDGAIEVHSRPGEGTVIDFYLPLLPEGEQPANLTLADRAPVAGRGRRILFVDDETALVRLMERGLGRLGYVVTGCNDPDEAIRMVQTDPSQFDLVVTDLSMPERSGFDVLRAIRAVSSTLRVILMSGYVRNEDRETAARLGVDDLLLKPNGVEDLAQAIDRLVA